MQNWELIHTTDWLGSNPIFFNSKTNQFSANFLEVIDINDCRISCDGLKDYLNYGYSVFGQTVIDNVKFTPFNSELWRNNLGQLKIVQLPDSISENLNFKSSVSDVIESIEVEMQSILSRSSNYDNIILPLSGGMDSKLIGLYLQGRTNVRAYTYGISDKQSKSFEVSGAKDFARRINLQWSQIELGEFHKYIGLNFDLYGASTHAHSMYHFEFYSKILESLDNQSRNLVISGISGDVWAGNWEFNEEIDSPSDLRLLSKSYGINAHKISNSLFNIDCTEPSSGEVLFFEENRRKLLDSKFRIITAARFKLMLLLHLIRTPESLGFQVAAPFLSENVVSKMLTLPPTLRADRTWQVTYLRENTPGRSSESQLKNHQNSLELQATRKFSLPNIFDQSSNQIITNINREKSMNSPKFFLHKLLRNIPSGRIQLLGDALDARFQRAYNLYMVLQPLDELAKRYSVRFPIR